jgi:hypothetical protein
MSRAARKRYERIYTRRAQQGFPRVSKAILHQDGSVTPAPPQRAPTPFSIEYYAKPKPTAFLLLPDRPRSAWGRLLDSLRRLMRRILK